MVQYLAGQKVDLDHKNNAGQTALMFVAAQNDLPVLSFLVEAGCDPQARDRGGKTALKWTYGWVMVGPSREITIPPEAWKEYGFRFGARALFIRGSKTSGGFSVCRRALLEGGVLSRLGPGSRLAGTARFGRGTIVLPSGIFVKPGDRLLTVRGSCCGLGFIARGPIFVEALKHPELEVFTAAPRLCSSAAE